MKQISEIRNKHWIRLFGCLVLLWIVGCTQADVDDDILLPTLKEVDAGFNLNVLANHIPVTRSILFTADATMESDSKRHRKVRLPVSGWGNMLAVSFCMLNIFLH